MLIALLHRRQSCYRCQYSLLAFLARLDAMVPYLVARYMFATLTHNETSLSTRGRAMGSSRSRILSDPSVDVSTLARR